VPQDSRGPTLFPMQYQVLARKWRPRNFHELVGQDHVSRTLMNALQSGRVAHAFLFSGPRGSGKTTTARILAKALNCHAGKPAEPCGQCPACLEIAAGNSIDVFEIDAASNRGIDEIRELKEKVRYSPARDKNKIFIIDEAHMLTSEAFNALLKTLEEPPAHVIFIMATTEYHKIPATILSRCQQYSFKLISFPLILERLSQIAAAENIQISQAALELVAVSSGGSMRDAMSALDQVIAFSGETVRDQDVAMLLGLIEPVFLADMVRAISQNDSATIVEIIGRLVESGQDLHNFCRSLLAQFRNLMVLKAGVGDPMLLGIPASLLPDLKGQAALFSREDLLRLFDVLLKVEADLKYATQVRFQLEMGIIEAAHIARMRSLDEVIADFSVLVRDDNSFQRSPLSARPATNVEPPAPAAAPARSEAKPAAAGRRHAPQAIRDVDPSAGGELESSRKYVSAVHAADDQMPSKQDSRELLLRIARAVQKESVASLLQNLSGARLSGNTVTLDAANANEFYRRQIKENLALIEEGASQILGRNVDVLIEAFTSPEKPKNTPSSVSQQPDILGRAKREPVIRSFLDLFPGPVEAEKIDQ
jgi:DNA polymerase-3 subunit gamma/tau